MKIFVRDQKAMEDMLPAAAAVVQREQELGAESVEWAGEYYGVDLAPGSYTYHLAREPDTGRILAAAIVTNSGYRDGRVRLAVGIDNENNVTGVAVLGVSQEYVADYEGTGIGTGFLERFAGLSLVDFTDQVNALKSRNEMAAAGLLETAVTLAALVRSAR